MSEGFFASRVGRGSLSPNLKYDPIGPSPAARATSSAAPYADDREGLAPLTDDAARQLRMGSRSMDYRLPSAAASTIISRGISQPTFLSRQPAPPPPPPGPAPDYGYGDGEDFGGDFDDEEDYDDDDALPMPPHPNDAVPVVPPDHLRTHTRRLVWDQHPGHGVVLALLTRRGVIPQLHKGLVDYHMAEPFLNCISALMKGSYFVRYAPKNASPKERFLNLQLLPDQNKRLAPYLCWYIHRTAVQMIDKVPLDDLVGVSAGFQSPAFRRWLVSHDVIKGCMQGHHRARMSTRGCFTLWFYDRASQQPRSLDLLTNNMAILQLWMRTMEGLLSVNSTCVSGSTDAGQEMQRIMKMVQQRIKAGDVDEEEHGVFAAQFIEH